MEAIAYTLIFITFMIIVFITLKALRIERAFEQGRVAQIKMAYAIICLICAYILTEFVCRLLGFAGVNL